MKRICLFHGGMEKKKKKPNHTFVYEKKKKNLITLLYEIASRFQTV